MMLFTLAALTVGLSAGVRPSRIDALEARAAEMKLGAADPFATLSLDGAFGDPSEVLGIYLYWDAPYGQVGRRRAIAVAKHQIETSDVLWASSQTCDGLDNIVAQMEAVTPPSIDVPGFGDHEGMPSFVSDGVTYTLSVRSPRWKDREFTSGYNLTFSANVGNPLGTWAEALRMTTSSCWSAERPEAG